VTSQLSRQFLPVWHLASRSARTFHRNWYPPTLNISTRKTLHHTFLSTRKRWQRSMHSLFCSLFYLSYCFSLFH
jgi:hypothetical protein